MWRVDLLIVEIFITEIFGKILIHHIRLDYQFHRDEIFIHYSIMITHILLSSRNRPSKYHERNISILHILNIEFRLFIFSFLPANLIMNASSLLCTDYLSIEELYERDTNENAVTCAFKRLPCVCIFLQEKKASREPRRNEICLHEAKKGTICGSSQIKYYNRRTNLNAQIVGFEYFEAHRLAARCKEHRYARGIFDEEINMLREYIAKKKFPLLPSHTQKALTEAQALEAKDRPLLQRRRKSRNVLRREFLAQTLYNTPKVLIDIIAQYAQHHTWLIYEKIYQETRDWVGFMFLQDHEGEKHIVDRRFCFLPIDAFVDLGIDKKRYLPLHEIVWESNENIRWRNKELCVDFEFLNLSLSAYQEQFLTKEIPYPHDPLTCVSIWVVPEDA